MSSVITYYDALSMHFYNKLWKENIQIPVSLLPDS